MSAETATTLDGLPNGAGGTVTELLCRPALARRLTAMGMVPGVRVRLLRRALGGDPLMVDVMGHPIALRRADASEILIRNGHASG